MMKTSPVVFLRRLRLAKKKSSVLFYLREVGSKTGLLFENVAPPHTKSIKSHENLVNSVVCDGCVPFAPSEKKIVIKTVTSDPSKVQVTCTAEGYPTPRLVLLKDGKKFKGQKKPKVKVKVSLSKVSHSFKASELTNKHLYACVAENVLGKANKTFSFSTPSISIERITEEEDTDPFELMCSSDTYPTPYIAWLFRGKVLKDNKGKGDQLRPSVTLKYPKPSTAFMFEDFTCTASNILGEQRHDISIREMPPVIKIEIRSIPGEAEHIEVECSTNVFPIPTLTWIKDGQVLKTNNGKSLTLRYISHINRQENYTLSCEATTKHGKTAKSISVEAKPAKISKISRVGSVNVNREFELTCHVEGFPEPVVQWKHNGQIVNHKLKKTTSTLTIAQIIRERGTYTYVCEAFNPFGNSSKKITIEVPVCENKTNGYCLNGGVCEITAGIEHCVCPISYRGERCDEQITDYITGQASLLFQRTLIIIGIVIALLVFVAICIASYVLAKRQQRKYNKSRTANPNHTANSPPTGGNSGPENGGGVIARDSSAPSMTEPKLGKSEMASPPTHPFPVPPFMRTGNKPAETRRRLCASSQYDNVRDLEAILDNDSSNTAKPYEKIQMAPLRSVGASPEPAEVQPSLGTPGESPSPGLPRDHHHPTPSPSAPPPVPTIQYSTSPSSPDNATSRQAFSTADPNSIQTFHPLGSRSDRDIARHLASTRNKHKTSHDPLENENLLKKAKLTSSNTFPTSKVNSVPLLDSDSDEDVRDIHYDLHITEEDLDLSKGSSYNSSSSSMRSPTGQQESLGLLASTHSSRPGVRKHQSEDSPSYNTPTNRRYGLQQEDNARSYSLDEPATKPAAPPSKHMNSTLLGSPESEYPHAAPGPCQHYNHNEYDPTDDEVPWDANSSKVTNDEHYKLKDVAPNQRPIPI
ncbi:uncharacterized protein LOC131950005 isoform X2 [Physella acuta]|uniref:uncharacterized protein LOC131950005 isoform X2 n=1 Tax=Physella acuta TaxID=109671 RepID=UPI0027DE7B38|nr:uncharacterized protein LOC131950005 isoform X2 [Physella acuta]